MKKIVIAGFSQGLVMASVCCNLSPDEMRERKKEAEELLPSTNVSHGWEIELDAKEYTPERCHDIEGFWHYFASC